MAVVIEHVRLPFRFAETKAAYFETEQRGASWLQEDNMRSKRLGQIQDSLRNWLRAEEELRITKDNKTKTTETSDVTGDNVIMSLPKYKADLDMINCYLYQTTSRNHYPPTSRRSQKMSIDQPIDPKLKQELFSLRSPRYGSNTELWQQVLHSEWDRNQTREPCKSVPDTLPDAKRQVLKKQICKKSIYPGEWVEPDQELIDYVLTGTSSNRSKRFEKEKDNRHSYLYQSSTKVSHRKFPDHEYSPSYFGHKSPLSITIDLTDQQSPFGNSEPPVKTGTWTNYLYQRRWS